MSDERNLSVKEALEQVRKMKGGGKASVTDDPSGSDTGADRVNRTTQISSSPGDVVSAGETADSLTEPSPSVEDLETRINRELDARERGFTGTLRDELGQFRTTTVQWVVGIVIGGVITLFAVVWATNDTLRSDIRAMLSTFREDVRREIDRLEEADSELRNQIEAQLESDVGNP